MGGQFFSEVPCILCRRPVDLQTDLCSNENGMAVHEDCYFRQITTAQHGNSPVSRVA
jgi:hypothetical protein